MKIGMVGLGRMGGNLVRRLMRDGHECVVYDRDPKALDAIAREGGIAAAGIDEMIEKLEPPRAVWVMLPAGPITRSVVSELGQKLNEGDIVIDGGNSFYKEAVEQERELLERGVRMVDVGTSGGVWGLERGYCLMIGAQPEVFAHLEPIFSTIAPGPGEWPRTRGLEGDRRAPEHGYLHCGPPGAGHFVKMVHNGIEYALMQAYAEGFDLLRAAGTVGTEEGWTFDLDLPNIAEVWRRGSVIGSWLLDLSAAALRADPSLEAFSGHVGDSGEGRWTVNTGVEMAVPLDVITGALYRRFRSRQQNTFGEKMLSAMRNEFGGHLEEGSTPS